MSWVRAGIGDVVRSMADETHGFQPQAPAVSRSGSSSRHTSPTIFREPFSGGDITLPSSRRAPLPGAKTFLASDASCAKRGAPRAARGEPPAVWGDVFFAWGATHFKWGAPHSIRGVPLFKSVTPHFLRAAPHFKKVAPQIARVLPPAVWGATPAAAVSSHLAVKQPFTLKIPAGVNFHPTPLSA